MEKAYIHTTAEVSNQAKIGSNTKVWHQCQIREKVVIGENCILGKNVYIDHDVKIGNNVKIQNNCSIYYDSEIEEGVFIGPHVCLTNDKSPRAITENGKLKTENEWKAGKILVKKGASIGAGSIILPDVTIGEFAMVGAGSVVTKDVQDYGLVYGNPAKLTGYVDKNGKKVRDK
jgi:acetyltransferase-like isoleucine patch superfamily enzyme